MTTERVKETDFAAYFEGRLPEGRRQEIERILAETPDLMDEFFSLYRLGQTRADREAGSAPERIVRNAISLLSADKGLFEVVLALVGDAVQVLSSASGIDLSSPRAAFALRSSGPEKPKIVVIRKFFDWGDVELDVQSAGTGLCTITVEVPAAVDFEFDHLRAELQSEGRIIASEQLSGGRSVFEAVGPGRYSVMLRKNRKFFGNITIRITGPSGEEHHD